MTKQRIFERGETVISAGLVVLKILQVVDVSGKPLYRVKFSCCGREADVSHKSIRQRERKQSLLCSHCVSGAGRSGRAAEQYRQRLTGMQSKPKHPAAIDRAFELYPKGVVEGANLSVIAVVSDPFPNYPHTIRESRQLTVYRVAYSCCGKACELTHTQIAKRVYDGRKLCHACKTEQMWSPERREAVSRGVIKQRELKDTQLCVSGPDPRSWPVPESARTMPAGWMPR